MPSSYLTTVEAPTYGTASTVTADQIKQASLLVDTYLRRPEGLVVTSDSTGNPCFMAAANQTGSFTIAAGLSIGQNVAATLSGPTNSLAAGAVLIADKADAVKMEDLLIVSITGNQATIKSVTKNHAADATYHTGLTIFESRHLPSNRSLVILSKSPIQKLVGLQGRYGYGRRGGSNNYTLNEFNLLAVMQQFGGPPIWENVDISHSDYNVETGQVWVPAGIMLAYYSEVRVNYVAGYDSAQIPEAIKLATANIVKSQAGSPLSGNTKLMKAGDTAMERFMDTVLDTDTRLMLSPYRARSYA